MLSMSMAYFCFSEADCQARDWCKQSPIIYPCHNVAVLQQKTKNREVADL